MKKKMIAPIVIGIIIGLYMIAWLCMFIWTKAPTAVVTIAAIPVIILLLLWVHVVMERIHEIRSGEEDDLSQY